MNTAIGITVSAAICVLTIGGTAFSIEGIRFYAGDLVRRIRRVKADPRLEAERANFRRMIRFGPVALVAGITLALACLP